MRFALFVCLTVCLAFVAAANSAENETSGNESVPAANSAVPRALTASSGSSISQPCATALHELANCAGQYLVPTLPNALSSGVCEPLCLIPRADVQSHCNATYLHGGYYYNSLVAAIALVVNTSNTNSLSYEQYNLIFHTIDQCEST